ncbi:MAG: hypothetical protein K9H49_06890 [Bacteroidales bacterium]|nr:hypothetical protein [Bacteroidales bacterium]MCF8390961.1 hypothetical protein [Bacteroidales bacterium]
METISYKQNEVPVSAGNLSLTYEDGGNISSKSDLANTIVYGDGTAGPHALTSIGDLNTAYLPSDQTISYTNFNKVSSISQMDENGDPINLTYTYGLDRQRIKTVFTRDAVTEKTKYFLGDYEEVTTSSGTKKYHYFGWNRIMCVSPLPTSSFTLAAECLNLAHEK